MPACLAASGSYVPERILRNEDLVQFDPEALPLIAQKTGVRARRHAAPGEVTSDLAAEAARRCLAKAGLSAQSLDAILLATSSPDRLQPPTATRVQHLIGAGRAFAFDLNAVCTGALYALRLANALLAEGNCRRVLVVAADLYSRFLDPEDFATYPYFGDGAGAVLLRAEVPAPRLVHLGTCLYSDGSGADLIQIPAGGTMRPVRDADRPRDAFFRMQGKKVFDFAVERGSEVIAEVLSAHGITVDDVHAVITHQANLNIIHEIARRTGLPRGLFHVNLDRIGNTASASVFIGVDEVLANAPIPAGRYVVLAAFGGGLAWGASVLRAE